MDYYTAERDTSDPPLRSTSLEVAVSHQRYEEDKAAVPVAMPGRIGTS